MITRRSRGFRLSRKLVTACKWILRRRAGTVRRRRMTAKTSFARKIIDLGRCLTSNICYSRRSYRRLGDKSTELLMDRSLEVVEGDTKKPPKGHLAVYVGDEKELGGSKRYVVPVIYFNDPLFCELLREAEEQFGYHHAGAITIPIPSDRFERVAAAAAAHSRRRL